MIYLIFTIAMILSFLLGFYEGTKNEIRLAARYAAHDFIASYFKSKVEK